MEPHVDASRGEWRRRAAPIVLHSGPGFCLRHEKAPIWRHHFLPQDGWSSEHKVYRGEKPLRDTDCMALHWHIESREKLFVVVADGNVELEEVERMLDELVGTGAIGYRKLFDGTLGETCMTSYELLSLGVRIRALHGGDTPPGPVAIVLPHDKRPPLMRLLGIMAAARRPLRIFDDLESAHKWLGAFRWIWQRRPETSQDGFGFSANSAGGR